MSIGHGNLAHCCTMRIWVIESIRLYLFALLLIQIYKEPSYVDSFKVASVVSFR